jgi:predicted dehydrogenase
MEDLMSKLKLGVLGCSGHYALRISTPLGKSQIVETYAVASRDGEKAKAYADEWGFAKSYGSYEALLADPDVDFVYIPLPNHLHCEFIKKAADAGKPILCEKPLGLNAKEAADAAAYCKRKGVPLMEAFMYRLHPQWTRAKEIVTCGEIGQVMSTQGFFSYNNTDPANIRNQAKTGGGAILDIGCYAVSSSRFLMGSEPERVAATLIKDKVFNTDILVSAVLDYGEGRSATFTVGTQVWPYQRVTAVGKGGFVQIEVPFNMYGDFPGHLTVQTDVGTRLVEPPIADQYLLEFDAFATAVRDKKPVPTPITDALSNMAVLDAVFEAAEKSAWVDVKQYPL